jgi:hypothetical protein
VEHPEGSQAVKIGVRLSRRPDDLGEWLADGAAFEAAGADALWIDVAPESELHPLALTAALAGLTFRSLLITTVPAPALPSQALAGLLNTVGRLSHGRLRILADPIPPGEPADVGPSPGVFRRISGDPECFEHTREPEALERWVAAPSPDGRAAWRATLLDAAERGFHGLVVPADPRLLDILRNPDDHGGRLDLQLAQG